MITRQQLNILLKKTTGKFISVSYASQILRLNHAHTTGILAKLEEEGIIQRSIINATWEISIKGQLHLNKKEKRVFRQSTIQKQLKDLLDRVQIVNTSTRYPLLVSCVKVLSPISDEKCSAINIVYTLRRKNISDEDYDVAVHLLRNEYRGMCDTILKYYSFPQTVVYRFLKSGSHVLNLLQYQRYEMDQLEGKTVFDSTQGMEK